MFHTMVTAQSATDENDAIVSCLKCGGVWYSIPEEAQEAFSRGYVSIYGDEAVACTEDTKQCHHYATECPRNGVCTLHPECNCLYCNS